MLLVSIDARALSSHHRQELWELVISSSLGQRAGAFSIEPVGRTRDKPESSDLDALLAASADGTGLRRIDGLTELIANVGPKVMSLGLFAHDGWIASISDWGDHIDVLFETEPWLRLKQALTSFDPPIPYDVAEVESRPPYSRR